MSAKTRNILTIDLYQWSSSDKKAIKKAEKLIKKLNDKYDCQAQILSIVEAPFASVSLNPRKIK